MLQPYGIYVGGDIYGGLLLAATAALVWCFSKKGAFIYLMAMMAWSTAGSASLLPKAMRDGDGAVLAYHGVWTFGGLIVVVLMAMSLLRAPKTSVVRAYTEEPLPNLAYESRPSGPDDRDGTVYKITSL